MIKYTGTAIVHNISPVIQIPSKTGGQPFEKRELILNDSWQRDGHQYNNFILVEFQGERMAQLDNFIPGQRVTVEGVIIGREYNGRIFHTVRGHTVTLYQQQPQPTPMPTGQAAPMPGYAPPLPQNPPRPVVRQVQPRPAAAPAPAPTQYAAPAPQYPAAQSYGPGTDDLPF